MDRIAEVLLGIGYARQCQNLVQTGKALVDRLFTVCSSHGFKKKIKADVAKVVKDDALDTASSSSIVLAVQKPHPSNRECLSTVSEALLVIRAKWNDIEPKQPLGLVGTSTDNSSCSTRNDFCCARRSSRAATIISEPGGSEPNSNRIAGDVRLN